MSKFPFLTMASLAAMVSFAAPEKPAAGSAPFKVAADAMAADNLTGAMVASGHVTAVQHPYRLMSDKLERQADGTYLFAPGTEATTCTNDLDHLHWDVSGEIVYRSNDSVLVRDATLRFFGVPLLWLPYMWYPLDSDCGFAFAPGYTSRWGAYLLTRYKYAIAGDHQHAPGSYYLDGTTRFDLRWEQGIAFGQQLEWQLGDYGAGEFRVYYAWDMDDRYDSYWSNNSEWNYQNWGSTVPDNRYAFMLKHLWEVTERDTMRVQGVLSSDSYFYQDFLRPRDQAFNINPEWGGVAGNEFAWEHTESWSGLGVSVSGPLETFYTGTQRLPELYFDIAPTPVWSLPINYESQTRIGYLRRRSASYGDSGTLAIYRNNPGEWADYDTFRFDTYHRLSAPFKVQDALSVVPRIGWHGTLWDKYGDTVVGGSGEAGEAGRSAMRNIIEGGITFAGRGTAWIDDKWQHMIEPYFDVLAQEAIYSKIDSDTTRPYIFDSIDASCDWSDQFAGRSRNLPYSYYGITPGLRNAWSMADEKGFLHEIVDFDVYVAMQFNKPEWVGDDEMSRLAEPGKPNYGDRGSMFVPGARLRWHPDDDFTVGARVEYDTDNNKLALADLQLQQKVTEAFSYSLSYMGRDHRAWDYSSYAYDKRYMREDSFNWLNYSTVQVAFEHEVCSSVAWGPFLRWDCRIGELDAVGGWIEYRTDCLGFRASMTYRNRYIQVDGSEYGEEWSFGFMIYLRAFGPSSGLTIGND